MHRFAFVRANRCIVLALFTLALVVTAQPGAAQNGMIEVCPQQTVVSPRPPDFEPTGLILTTFDKEALWVFNVSNGFRYPLPGTFPCALGCRLSHDARWIIYFSDETNTHNKMRLDGTSRTILAENAADIEWWSPDTLLIWTPNHDAYLRPETGTSRQYLDVDGVHSIQPGGRWGLLVEPAGDAFNRALVNLEVRSFMGIAEQRIYLGADRPYFNDSAWSPDGNWLAYVGAGIFDDAVGIAGGELYAATPVDGTILQLTNLTASYGAVRINGQSVSALRWSPDGTKIAFWVSELNGPDPEANVAESMIHVLDVTTGELRAYCGFTTFDNTPNPPRLVWSPDSTTLAFGANIVGDDKGFLLLALTVETGIFTELSEGIFPAIGTPAVIAWGLPPG